jgi:hypothetical protein
MASGRRPPTPLHFSDEGITIHVAGKWGTRPASENASEIALGGRPPVRHEIVVRKFVNRFRNNHICDIVKGSANLSPCFAS